MENNSNNRGITVDALYAYYYNYAWALITRNTTKQHDRLIESIEDGFIEGGYNREASQRLSNNVWHLAHKRAKEERAREKEEEFKADLARIVAMRGTDDDVIIINPDNEYDDAETFSLI